MGNCEPAAEICMTGDSGCRGVLSLWGAALGQQDGLQPSLIPAVPQLLHLGKAEASLWICGEAGALPWKFRGCQRGMGNPFLQASPKTGTNSARSFLGGSQPQFPRKLCGIHLQQEGLV